MRCLIGLLASLTLFASATYGQIPAPSAAGLWISGARGARVETRGGTRHDRSLVALGVRATWRLSTDGPVDLEYTADLIPLILATANRAYRWEGSCSGQDGACNYAVLRVPIPYTTVGVGFAPVGLQFRARLRPAVAVVASGDAGVLYFGRPVPDHEAARLNFVGEMGGGLELALRADRIVALGYRFQHISNAGIAPINVGINTHLLLVGVVIPR